VPALPAGGGSLGDEALESRRIDEVLGHVKPVTGPGARALGHQADVVLLARRAEVLAQPGNVTPDRRPACLGRVVIPDQVGQALLGHYIPATQVKRDQQCALNGTEADRLAID
jgi:hypothetical protein